MINTLNLLMPRSNELKKKDFDREDGSNIAWDEAQVDSRYAMDVDPDENDPDFDDEDEDEEDEELENDEDYEPDFDKNSDAATKIVVK